MSYPCKYSKVHKLPTIHSQLHFTGAAIGYAINLTIGSSPVDHVFITKFLLVGRTIINNYIAKEGVINNTVERVDDPKKDNTPDRSNRLIIVTISTVAALLSIIAFIVQYMPNPAVTSGVKSNNPTQDSTSTAPSHSSQALIHTNTDDTKNRRSSDPSRKDIQFPIPASKSSLNRSTLALCVQDASHNFDAITSQKISDFLNSQNHKSTITPEAFHHDHFAQVVKGMLYISDTSDIRGANGSHTLVFTVILSLSFNDKVRKESCSISFSTCVKTRKYSTVPNRKDIQQQGLDKILSDLKNSHQIPLCTIE